MLVVLLTHPIQYQAPLWRTLAADGRVPFEVWYLTDHGVQESWDPEFGRRFAWDLPLLEGYPHRFIAANPGWTMDPHRPDRLRLGAPLEPLLRARGARAILLPGWHKLALWQALAAARRAGVPVWMRAESNDLGRRAPWRRWLRRRLHWSLFRRCAHFLAIGAANRRLYLGAGVPLGRISPAPYAVENERFAGQAEQLRGARADLRRAWGIPPDAFCVLFCGKMTPKKRPLDLVAAARRLAATGLRPHLLFVGSGELDSAVRAECAVAFDATGPAGVDRSPRPAASFPGFLNQREISRAYVAADCLALPSDAGETWGLVVNEALASGLPAVASAATGCAEDLVAPLDPRLRFPCGDVAALADALATVATRPPSAARLRALVDQFHFRITVDSLAALHGSGVRACAAAT